MPKSLRCKLSDLRYKRLITDEEYQEMIKKLNGHDREIRNKAIDDFAKQLKKGFPITDNGLFTVNDTLHAIMDEIAEQLKGE